MKSEDEYSDVDSMEEDEDVFDDDDDVDMSNDDLMAGESLSDEEDEVEEEEEFVDLKNDDSTKRKVFETPYKVWTVADLEKKQVEMSERVGGLLGLNASTAAMLLRAFKWHEDSLVERYMEDPEKVLVAAGLPSDVDQVTHKYAFEPAPAGFMCFICCNEADDQEDGEEPMVTFALSCGHRLCKDCYSYYVKQKIWEEQLAKSIKCPGEKCSLIVSEQAVKLLVDSAIYAKYRTLLDESFVNDNELFKFCPGPNCGNAIECHVRQSDLNSIVPTVTCTSCGYMFCFGCKNEDHMPCTCNITRMWLKKCQDDSETSNWISANTKDCPKCNSCIEKNGGCNHMTCKKCQYEFCWVCMGDWKAHGRNYYNCSRFEEDGTENAKTKDKSRAELERYLHYYNRYSNHQQSLRLDKETFRKIEKKMKDLQDASGMSWIEVQFLTQAFEVLQRSRRTLTWTYAFAYYLKKGHITTIFEDNQKDLEMATEQLSEIFERPANDLASQKVPMLDKCAYVSQRRDILLEDAARGLIEGTWEYNVPIERVYI